ncbi:MAG: ATP-binding protein [Sporomusaceae bacterium]|nr:ATP-binding protein [Sporomusaceae bacterium]
MAIQQPMALINKTKKIRILIAGYPGIGKSTLALSAPNPLHIDVDRGIDRVSAIHRKPFIQPLSYDELKEDLVPDNLRDFDTLVFDTGGQLIKLIGAWAIRQAAQNGQKDGSLSLKGYGAVGREFERLMNYCYYDLNKHIVVLFHAKEEKDGDNTRLRLLVEGQTKDNVWQPMDLGGYMEMNGSKRTIGFANCERYYAKGTHGISGVMNLPELKPDKPNDFLTRLFAEVNSNIATEAEQILAEQQQYEAVMAEARDIVDAVATPEAATDAVKQITALAHILTSEREAKAMLVNKAKTLGYVWDGKTRGYQCAG